MFCSLGRSQFFCWPKQKTVVFTWFLVRGGVREEKLASWRSFDRDGVTYRQHSLNIALMSLGAASLRQTVWIFETQANKASKTWVYKVWTFRSEWICNEDPTAKQKTRPPDDFETTIWSIAICSPNFEGSGTSASGSCPRWDFTRFEKSLAQLQMSHNGCLGKWLSGCSIDTASALARTADLGSLGSRTSGVFYIWLLRRRMIDFPNLRQAQQLAQQPKCREQLRSDFWGSSHFQISNIMFYRS